MLLPNLTIATIKRAASEKSFERGESYFKSGAVIGLTLRQNILQAEVEGNEVHPYRVTAIFDQGGVTECDCSCPYDWDGWCKHIVATLLTCVHQPETIEERPSLGQLLAKLDLAKAKALIESWVTDDPQLLESLDFFVHRAIPAEKSATLGTPRQRKTSVDPDPYKRQVHNILRDAVQGWEDGNDDDNIGYELEQLINDALAFAENGDGRSTLVLLKGITEGCIEYWHLIDDFVGSSLIDFGIDLDPAWTEGILSTELTEEESLSWQEKLEDWSDSLGDFSMAIEALRQGWNYPPLQRVFQGIPSKYGAWSGEPPSWGEEFSRIRLKILDRQQRHDDYLQLAKAEGQTQAYLTMLGRLGRVEQAMTVAQEQMTTLEEAKALAETLRDQNQIPQALTVAMTGLTLTCDSPYLLFEFASWTRDLAEGLGDQTAQLTANIIAFKARPSLKDYQAIETLSEDDWSSTKEDLLQHLINSDDWFNTEAKVDIFLRENRLDDAIKTVSAHNSAHNPSLCLRVMDATIASHSQWVLDTAIANAEVIMNAGQAKSYYSAVEWLKRAKAAYCELDREAEWLTYRRQLKNIHGRKRKLMDLLAQNRL
jgi:uncharacterized Zn finger protein